jgi:SAM-dependent methyltransferase
MKDLFSSRPADYARYRPTYPEPLVSFLLSKVRAHRRAWDCGTGNGQFAALLAPHFEEITATDISAAQIAHAPRLNNVTFLLSPAERSTLPSASVDLVVAAQAIHWFDHDRFYAEARRVLVPGGTIAAVGYRRCTLGAGLDAILLDFYRNVIGPYWDPERAHIDARYRSLPFPFEEIPSPEFSSSLRWTRSEILGYVGTWSAVERCRAARALDPLPALDDELRRAWPETEAIDVHLPFMMRIGYVHGDARPV